jgi:ribosomal-protein-alanine N-acetyltransferase
MVRRDLPKVLKIEQDSFETPWTEDDFIRTLRIRNCIGMVAERNDHVEGYMVYELHKSRLHVLNLAVNESLRGCGCGTALIKKLQGKLSPDRRKRLMVEVRESNLDAQLFFKAMGFQAISVLKGFYDDSSEDAYLMQCSVCQTPVGTSPANRISRLIG